ncbi:hypothetical protein [Xanthobacter sediminis]
MRLPIILGVSACLLISSSVNSADEFEIAKTVVSERLKDPESARFADLSLSPDGKIVCGKVNAKNAFSGYVGPQRFRYFIEDRKAVIVDREGISTVFLDSIAQPGSFCP